MHNPLAVVGMLGARLRRERTGWRDAKALLLVVAMSDSPTQDLAHALGITDEAMIEEVYWEARARVIAAHEQDGHAALAAGCQACAERTPHRRDATPLADAG